MNQQLQKLILQISKLPGIGKRSAQRIALHLLENKNSLMLPMGNSILESAEKIINCGVCGNFDEESPCGVCCDIKRDKSVICVVESVADMWAMERGNIYRGQYHILGGVLSAIEGIGPNDLRINGLIERIKQQNEIKEVILATNATLEGQTTAHYISRQIEEKIESGKIEHITRLANGIPLGGELEYIDEGTLSTALQSRKAI